jgi:DNA-binding IclR family transcriptional regulator
VKRYETAYRLGTSITVGSRMPLHASASGKCLLAGLSEAEIAEIYPDEELPFQSTNTIGDRTALFAEMREVRARGYAFNTDEFLDGVSALAVPVRLGDKVVASLSIAGPTTRFRASDWVEDLRGLITPRATVGGRAADHRPDAASTATAHRSSEVLTQ